MTSELLYITKNIRYSDLLSGEASRIDVYEAQVTEWLFDAAKELGKMRSENKFLGMSMFAIELLFFEPHGAIVLGNPDKRSPTKFTAGFERFRDYLISENRIEQNAENLDSNLVYKWARCGLFHSSTLGTELLLDLTDNVNCGLSRNPYVDGWLVNPWIMLDELESYFGAFIQDLRNEADRALNENFERVFDYTVSNPLDNLIGKWSEGIATNQKNSG